MVNRTILGALVAAALVFPFAPVTARAFTGPGWACDDKDVGMAGQGDSNIMHNVEFDTTGDMPGGYGESLKEYLFQVKLFNAQNCSESENSLYIVSFLDVWHSWLLHESNKSWDTSLELAIQMLTKCASHYYATPNGARCENWQEKAIAWKTKWEEGGP
jgi:hypothetical protein